MFGHKDAWKKDTDAILKRWINGDPWGTMQPPTPTEVWVLGFCCFAAGVMCAVIASAIGW